MGALFVGVQFLEAVDDVLDHALAVHHLRVLHVGVAHKLLLPLHLHHLHVLHILFLAVSKRYGSPEFLVSVGKDALVSELTTIFVEVLALGGLEVVVHASLGLVGELVVGDGALLGVRLDERRVRGQWLNERILHQLCLSVPSLRARSGTFPSRDTPLLLEMNLLFCQ